MADTAVRPKLVFFGSGPVAAESLRLLLEWCDVEAVITKPQPPHHREKFPVIAVAETAGVAMHFARNRRELDEVMAGQTFTSRVAVLIDYGIIVSQAVIDSFELGIINSHFSLLPEWRGADPISFSILSGQAQTGVSLMLLVEAMDEGPLLGYGEYDLPPDITTPQLTDYLIKLSDALLRHDLPRHLAGETKGGVSQSITGRETSYSRKLSKADGVLDFTKPAIQLEREIRAYAEWPKSRTMVGGRDVIVTGSHVAREPSATELAQAPAAGQPITIAIGDFFQTAEHQLAVLTADGVLFIDAIKPAGKGVMTGREFARNFPLR